MSAIRGALRKKEEVKLYYQRYAVAGLPEASELFTLLAEDEERHCTAMAELEQGARTRLDPR